MTNEDKKNREHVIIRRTLVIKVLLYMNDNKNKDVWVSMLAKHFIVGDVQLLNSINRLEFAGLVKKEKSKTNKNITLLKLTPKAEKTIPHITEIYNIVK